MTKGKRGAGQGRAGHAGEGSNGGISSENHEIVQHADGGTTRRDNDSPANPRKNLHRRDEARVMPSRVTGSCL